MGVFRGQMQHLNDHAGAVVGLVLSDLLFVSLKIPQLWSDEGSDRVLGSIKLFQTKRWQIYGYVCCLPPAANLRLPVKDQQGSVISSSLLPVHRQEGVSYFQGIIHFFCFFHCPQKCFTSTLFHSAKAYAQAWI